MGYCSLYATEMVSYFRQVRLSISWNMPRVISMSFVCRRKKTGGPHGRCPGGSLTGFLEGGSTYLSLAEH